MSAQQNMEVSFAHEKFGEKLEFQLYPNPLNGNVLHIVSNNTKLKNIIILNILGEVVFQTSTNENYVSLNNLNPGIYIVKIKQGSNQGLTRLVIR